MVIQLSRCYFLNNYFLINTLNNNNNNNKKKKNILEVPLYLVTITYIGAS